MNTQDIQRAFQGAYESIKEQHKPTTGKGSLVDWLTSSPVKPQRKLRGPGYTRKTKKR